VKLSNNSFSKLIVGSCNSKTYHGYISYYHYTDEQISYFDSLDESWGIRARLSCGVRAEFLTSATKFEFDSFVPQFGSYDSTIDLFINNVPYAVHHITGTGKNHISFDFPEGTKKVTIYFPTDSLLYMKNFQINDSYKATRIRYKKMLVIGDSISQGYGAGIAGFNYINCLGRKIKYEILNQGVGGYVYDPGCISLIDNFTPDKIFVQVGTNCYDVLSFNYEERVIKFYKRLYEVYPKTPVMVMTPLWRGDGIVDYSRLKWCSDIIKRECAKYDNIVVVDGFDLIPHLSIFYSDNLHPNLLGCEYMASNIEKKMRTIKFI